MTEAENLHLEPAARQILAFMGRNVETAYTPDDLASETGVPLGDVQAALAKLERLGYVGRAQSTGFDEAYNITPLAPRG